MRDHLLRGLLLGLAFSASFSWGRQEPNWSGPVIARGEQREAIESMDILDRPYRPLHVYGNTVRRRHYRGRTAPNARDVSRGAATTASRD